MSENRKENPSPIVYAPVHLKTALEIAKIFGVSVHRVYSWKRKGAPIRKLDGLNANYEQLWNWLLSHEK